MTEQPAWPECCGDPASCPENEGYGCCGGKAAQADELKRDYSTMARESLINECQRLYKINRKLLGDLNHERSEVHRLCQQPKRESSLQPLKDHLLKMAESSEHAGALSFPLAYEMHQRTLEAIALLVRSEKAEAAQAEGLPPQQVEVEETSQTEDVIEAAGAFLASFDFAMRDGTPLKAIRPNAEILRELLGWPVQEGK